MTGNCNKCSERKPLVLAGRVCGTCSKELNRQWPAAVLAGAVLGPAATKHELPVTESPDIPLPSFAGLDLSVKLTHKEPVNKPTEATLTFTLSPEDKKKKDTSNTAKVAAEKKQLQEELEKFKKGMKVKP